MNDIHLHLILVHVSIVLFPIAVLIMGWGLFGGSRDIKRVGLLLIILAAVNILPAYHFGHESEEKLEDVQGFSEKTIHQHSRPAKKTRYVVVASGVFALLTLVGLQTNRRWEKQMLQATIVLSLVGCGFLTWTAYKGGMIRHPEAFPELPQPPAKVKHSAPATPPAIPTPEPTK